MGTQTALQTQASARPFSPVLVGLLGSGISGSRTPAMHEAEGCALGINYIYRKLDTEVLGKPVNLADIVRHAEFMGYDGLNITYPYKQQILPLLDVLSENARAVSAVNTVVFRNGQRFGHNTDIWGFAQAFRQQMPGAACDQVLQIGAGGAGVAVANALMAEGVGTLLIHDTDSARAASLAATLCARFGAGRARLVADPAAIAGEMNGIVNATPVGMDKLPGMPLPIALVPQSAWVADVIYFPLHTKFLRAAKSKGCRIMNGAGMAVYQAVRAFELFTGARPDPDRMKTTFDSFTTVQDTN